MELLTEAQECAAPTLEDWLTIDQLVQINPDLLNIATLRWQLRHRTTNGLAFACQVVGKKTAISRSRYELWLARRVEASQ